MAVQSSFYNIDGTTKTFPSTKHIASSQHVAVWLKRVSDNVWEMSSISAWTLVNNSIVFSVAPFTYLYSQLEVRIADEADELADSPTDVALVAANIANINILADNIDLLSSNVNNEYIVSELPTTASEGDVAVNVVDGGIYEYTNGTWLLIGTSGGGTVSSGVIVPLENGLPIGGTVGEFIFNTVDGLFYAYIDGTWQSVVAPPSGDIGITVYATNPTTGLYEGMVIFNNTLNQLLRYTNGVWTQVVEPTVAAQEVADGSVTIAKFASGIRPIEIVDLLPTVGNIVGRLVYLTTDGKVYRYTATGFTSAVPTVDLTGQITTTQITDDAITTAKIIAGAITATEIAAASITSSHITANSITTGMIQAGAIGASQIAADAITTDKIYAGSVIASKIAASSIDATKIVAGSIGATQLAANSVIAGKIAAGAVSTDQLSASCVTANQIAAGAITATKLDVYALSAARFYCSDTNLSYSTYRNYTTTTASSIAVGAVCNNASAGSVGVLGQATGTGNKGVYGINTSTGGYGVYGKAATGGYGLVTDQACWATGGFHTPSNIYSFTGSHSAFTYDDLIIGDIVYVDSVSPIDINQTYPTVKACTTSYEKRVIGVVSYKNPSAYTFMLGTRVVYEPEEFVNNKFTNINVIRKEYATLVKKLKDEPIIKYVGINSLGEGMLNVCSENGNIESGDFLCSSNVLGKAMKQSDDLLHNHTVAKALESVDWSKETATTKMIACTYHAG